ncbi:hypothetical protein SAMN05192561_1082 [Halopenitus malekzadehii]|uniref:DUF3566 domain-containing protein n=1 Tax=Halopenitus malekzadehii TaxID=1267564 RepID=A0A1H6JAY2_9EURY|nr:hypothetical protein [Halopenitus malekzadehii]SEH56794.1 hypothetical protein SAMN05192561_1082 [Halopenitus malekzadehii]
MATHELTSIDIGSLLRIGAVLGALYGALFGVPLGLLSVLLDSGFGLVGAVLIVVISALSVAVSVAITGVAYNLIATLAGGGVKVTLEGAGHGSGHQRR